MFEVVSDFVRSLWDNDQTPPASPQSWYLASTTPPRTPLPDPDHYLEALRPRRKLRRTAFLPNTPTKSHQPPARRIQKRGKPKAFRCPSCKCRITITPAGNPSRVFKPYEAPPPKPQQEEEETIYSLPKRSFRDFRTNWLKAGRRPYVEL